MEDPAEYSQEWHDAETDYNGVVEIGGTDGQFGWEEEEDVCENGKEDGPDVDHIAEFAEVEVSWSDVERYSIERGPSANQEEDDWDDVRDLKEDDGRGQNRLKSCVRAEVDTAKDDDKESVQSDGWHWHLDSRGL